MAKASTSKSSQHGKSTTGPYPDSENRGMELPPARPVRQRQRSPVGAPVVGATASTGRAAVIGPDGPPHATSKAARTEASNDNASGPDASSESLDYTVGYGKPPKHTQFRKGKSGNPAGRPRGSRNMRTMYLEERNRLIEIIENGQRKKIPVMQVLLRTNFNNGIKGNAKSSSEVFKMEVVYGPDDPLPVSTLAEHFGTQDERDVELLAELQRILKQEDEVHLVPQTGAEVPSTSEEQPVETSGGPEDCSGDPGPAELLEEDAGPSPGQATPSNREHDVDRPVHRPLRAFRDGEWH